MTDFKVTNYDVKDVLNFIAGEFCPARSGAQFQRKNPSTGSIIGSAANSDAVDVVMAVQAANRALEAWSKTTVEDRSQVLNAVADGIEKNLNAFAECEFVDVGTAVTESRSVSGENAVLIFRHFAAKILTSETSALEIRQPVGVCAIITSFDFSLAQLSHQLAPCLGMGNTAVCKPSPFASLTANLLATILHEAGVPPGVCNFVQSQNETAPIALAQHPGVALVSFAGSTEHGIQVQKLAAQSVKKLNLDLGAKNAAIVLKDADLKQAATTLVQAAFLNSGQNSLSCSRLFVQDEIYEPFMAEYRAQVSALDIGPLVSEDQLAKVDAVVAQAKAEKAKVTAGGKRSNIKTGGYCYAATIIEDLDNCSDLWAHEIFGPVVLVQSFKYAHDAIRLANTSTYGLVAGIFIGDVARGQKLARELKVGTVWLNSWGVRSPERAFGGARTSGSGRMGGERSLDFYSEIKTIFI